MDKNLIIKTIKFIFYFLLVILWGSLAITGQLNKIVTSIGLNSEGVLGNILIGLMIGIPLGILLKLIFDLFPSAYKARKEFRWNSREEERVASRYIGFKTRTLTSEELSWTEDAATKMVAEISKDQKIGLIGTTVSGIIGLLILILSVLIFGGTTMAVIKFFQVQELWGVLSWYRIETVGGSTFLAILAGVCFAGWLFGRAFLLTEKPARHYKKFSRYYREHSRSYWRDVIYGLTHKGAISTAIDADINLIWKAHWRRHSKLYGVWTIFLSGLVLILLPLDIKHNTTIYKNHIDHSPYTSLLTRSYTEQDIIEVKRTCRIIVKARHHYRPKANLRYELVMSDGREVPIYGRDEGASIQKQIQALQYWHKTISADKFTPIQISSTHEKEIAATKQRCASFIKCNCTHSNYNALVRLFDLTP